MSKCMCIGKKTIGDSEPTFVVAELGVNHNQDLRLAKKLIEAAGNAGADAVKFQTWKTENIILRDTEMAKYQRVNLESNMSQYEMLKELELPYEWHFELRKHAEELGLIFFSTMEDRESVDFLTQNLNIPLIKVGSGDLTNYSLLKYTASKGQPMVLSTGMATLAEIDDAVRIVFETGNKNIVLLHCTSSYPCSYEEVNLNTLVTLKEAFKTIVGYSDHTLTTEVSVAAVALGAKYIEKHLTIDRNLPGPDHKASLEPGEFRKMVDMIRNVEKALGDGFKRPMPSELENKKMIRRVIVVSRDLKRGETLNENNISFKRASVGIEAKYYEFVMGKKLRTHVKKDHIIALSDIE